MRSSSAGALADMRDTWEALLREHEGEELALAREIFAAANTLAAHRGLSRALTDPSRDDDDRAQLARDVFASAVTEEVLDLLVGMALIAMCFKLMQVRHCFPSSRKFEN